MKEAIMEAAEAYPAILRRFNISPSNIFYIILPYSHPTVFLTLLV
jgi:hypothetical protein